MTRIDDERVVSLASAGLNNVHIARILSCDETSVRRALRRSGYQKDLIPLDLEDRFLTELDTPIILRDVDVMVTADWHIPLYDPRRINEVILKAQELGITKLIIAGDLFNFDALSQYDPKQEGAGLQREIDEARKVMRAVARTFDDIYFIWGNHDARLHKTLGYKLQFKNAMRLLLDGEEYQSKLHISNLDHLWIEFTDKPEYAERWRICHPQNYSRVPLTTPRVMASKFNANVICAHAHHAAIGFAVDGARTVVEIGGLFDQDKTAYLQRSTTFPVWTPGYGWFKDGRFHLTTPFWEV